MLNIDCDYKYKVDDNVTFRGNNHIVIARVPKEAIKRKMSFNYYLINGFGYPVPEFELKSFL